MIHPSKWRETCDLFDLQYRTFQPTEILGYPHAGNDVFHVRGIYEGKEISAYIKAARRKGAAIENEVEILRQMSGFPGVPQVLDHGGGDCPFIVTSERPGQRLSVIAAQQERETLTDYMEEYGEALGRVHRLRLEANPVADRRFFHVPHDDLLEKLELAFLKPYFARKPGASEIVFCHGDFHYANLLWKDHHISGILDFELAGYGKRDFDIAWALILRPGQKFLKTEEERVRFLEGYGKYGQCDAHAVRYYMAQIYVYFLSFSGDDRTYCEEVRRWLRENCG